MADPMIYDLTVRGVSKNEAHRIGEELVAMELAAEGESALISYPISRKPRYCGEERVANFEGPGDTKWSADEDDLKALSGQFPGKLFELAAHGYPDDDCMIYARDGLGCVIEPYRVWPAFDESMLA